MNDNGWMQTVSGKRVFPLAPTVDAIDINDIAHALSMTCRFGGHTKFHYSVAQHSVLVSDQAWDSCDGTERECAEQALIGLLHDATEAYLVDVPRPIKKVLPEYMRLEDMMSVVIAKKFNIASLYNNLIKGIDDAILVSEWKKLISPEVPRNILAYQTTKIDIEIDSWTQMEAKREFMTSFNDLNNILEINTRS